MSDLFSLFPEPEKPPRAATVAPAPEQDAFVRLQLAAAALLGTPRALRERLEREAKAKRIEAVVYGRRSCDCPVAVLCCDALTGIVAGDFECSYVELTIKMGLSPEVVVMELPEWAREFMKGLDGCKERSPVDLQVTAKEALAVLNGVAGASEGGLFG